MTDKQLKNKVEFYVGLKDRLAGLINENRMVVHVCREKERIALAKIKEYQEEDKLIETKLDTLGLPP